MVLGRELSIDQLREIRRQTIVPLEFFVHGALCVSHSGQCYLSHYIGNRSANRGACAQPCRLPWDLLDAEGKVLIKGKHLLCLKDLNNSAHLEELMDAGVTSFKIEGRLKDADYVKNVTAYYRQRIDEILERRPEFVRASQGRCNYTFEVNPEKSFNRGFTDYFIHGRQPNIGSPDTPKSMGEYVGEVKWCNSVQMEIATEKTLHNGDGLCFLDRDGALVGIRADVVRPARDTACRVSTVVCNRPHAAYRGAIIYRNYDIEWQKQVDASTGNRKIDMALVLEETEEGFELKAERLELRVENRNQKSLSPFAFHLSTPKIPALNPEKATENIRKKILQWGDTVFNPVSLELRFSEPRLIPASVLGEMKRGLVEQMTEALVENHRNARPLRDISKGRAASEVPYPETALSYLGNVSNLLATEFYRSHGVGEIEDALEKSFSKQLGLRLMTTHHCIRFANGMCSKVTGQKAVPLYLRHGDNTFRLEFDCKHCVMNIYSV